MIFFQIRSKLQERDLLLFDWFDGQNILLQFGILYQREDKVKPVCLPGQKSTWYAPFADHKIFWLSADFGIAH